MRHTIYFLLEKMAERFTGCLAVSRFLYEVFNAPEQLDVFFDADMS